MENLEIIKERFIRDSFNVRLGGIAANLARVSSFLDNKANKEVVRAILEESKYLIEWTACDATLEIQELFSEIQPTLALWQHLLSEDTERRLIGDIKEKADTWSRRLLESSGLLD